MDDIERFLIGKVDDTLSEGEREVMRGVAVLLGYPGTREAIEVALDSDNVRRQLRHLADRFLLTTRDRAGG